MGIFESFRVAFDMLRLHKLRAFLTMLGVIIGVMSVSLIVEVSNGFRHFLTDEIKKLGSDTILVFFDAGRNTKQSLGAYDKLTLDDVEYVRQRAWKTEMTSGVMMINGKPVRVGDLELKDARILATDENQAILTQVGITAGRHLVHDDLELLSNVCVIGNEVRERLFQGKDPLGQTITFSGLTLSVVGVMDRVDLMGQSNGKDVWMPITTAQKKWIGGEGISYFMCRPKAGYTVEEGMNNVWETLMVRSNNKPIYRVDSRESIINVFGIIIGSAGALLAGVAALSLLVGGIGIMNIMLVSVTERTREIGLRKAVGAQRSAILTQFLVESAFLSLVGGLIGMLVAFGIGQIITLITIQTKWPTKSGLQMSFDFPTALGALIFSALIGVVFGIYPAARASQLSPIEALRAE